MESQDIMQRRVWTAEEDTQLVRLVNELGFGSWASVSKQLQKTFLGISRSGKQCRQRYCNHLDPAINRSDWEPSEQAKFIELWFKHGNRWTKIAQLMAGRTESSLKNYFYSNLRRAVRLLNRNADKSRELKQFSMQTLNSLQTAFPLASRDDLHKLMDSLFELGKCSKSNAKSKGSISEQLDRTMAIIKSFNKTSGKQQELEQQKLEDRQPVQLRQQPKQHRQFRRVQSFDLGKHVYSPAASEISNQNCPDQFLRFLNMGNSQLVAQRSEASQPNMSYFLNNSCINQNK